VIRRYKHAFATDGGEKKRKPEKAICLEIGVDDYLANHFFTLSNIGAHHGVLMARRGSGTLAALRLIGESRIMRGDIPLFLPDSGYRTVPVNDGPPGYFFSSRDYFGTFVCSVR
jgi:hypothetical protein